MAAVTLYFCVAELNMLGCSPHRGGWERVAAVGHVGYLPPSGEEGVYHGASFDVTCSDGLKK